MQKLDRYYASIFILVLVSAVLVVPAIVLGGGGNFADNEGRDQGDKDVQEEHSSPDEFTIAVYDVSIAKTVEMPLDEYLVGVLAAEVPARFEKEALKAQAVAARTYLLRKVRALGGKGCSKHTEADICTDSTHCQAWMSREEAENRWPAEKAAEYYARLQQAVQETAKLVLTHDGELIDAVYHSTCGGHTEDAGSVWSVSPDYLRGVECSYCEESPAFKTETVITMPELAARLEGTQETLPVAAGNVPLFEVHKHTATGRVGKIQIGGQIYTGPQLRNLLELPSTRMQWRLEGNKIIIINQGFGHGVGLCQYGAQGMAQKGYSFADILKHYFQNVELTVVSEN